MIFKFFTIMSAVFIAEMGDKTQLLLVAFSSKYKVRDIVCGTGAAILVLNALAVMLGSFAGSLIPLWIVKFSAGILFLVFSVTSLNDDENEEEKKIVKSGLSAAAVFFSFMIAEFGDKTQFAALTFGASEGLKLCILVWAACSAGLFLADMIGLAAGLIFKRTFSSAFIKILSSCLFAFFGFASIYNGIRLCPFNLPLWKIMGGIGIVFLLILSVLIFRRKSCR